MCHKLGANICNGTLGEMGLTEIMEEVDHVFCEGQKISVLGARVEAQEGVGDPLRHADRRLVVGKCLQDEPVAVATVAETQQIPKDRGNEVKAILICGEPAIPDELGLNETMQSLNHRVGHAGTGVRVNWSLVLHVRIHIGWIVADSIPFGVEEENLPRMVKQVDHI